MGNAPPSCCWMRTVALEIARAGCDLHIATRRVEPQGPGGMAKPSPAKRASLHPRKALRAGWRCCFYITAAQNEQKLDVLCSKNGSPVLVGCWWHPPCSPFLSRKVSRFSFRLSSLSSTNLRIDASSTCVRGAPVGDQQLWVRAVLPQQLLALTSFSCPEHPSFTGTQTRKALPKAPRRPLHPQPGEGTQRGLPGSCSQTHSSHPGSGSSWRCGTGAARQPATRQGGVTEPVAGISTSPELCIPHGYLGQCQLLALQELLC